MPWRSRSSIRNLSQSFSHRAQKSFSRQIRPSPISPSHLCSIVSSPSQPLVVQSPVTSSRSCCLSIASAPSLWRLSSIASSALQSRFSHLIVTATITRLHLSITSLPSRLPIAPLPMHAETLDSQKCTLLLCTFVFES